MDVIFIAVGMSTNRYIVSFAINQYYRFDTGIEESFRHLYICRTP